MSGERLWWRDGVVYQIYPRSYQDANGDGVGDLEGIRRRLDHLAWLGVDALWLSPFQPSPMADFGYDVADYCGVDPLFGTLADFDRLLADAHARGIRVTVDWVPNHSSDQHPWFRESRAARDSAKRDWYVWRDGRGGQAPNNWCSIFGGPAWQHDPATGQWYLHSFLREQPDLNWRSPELVRAMHEVLRFWLERGADGFRIDVIHRIAKDPALRDNPPNPAGGSGYGGQLHVHDENHPDVHSMLRGIRAVLDRYGERMMVGEVYLFDPAEVAKYYGKGDELHLAFNFSFLRCPWDAAAFRAEVERFEALCPPEGWPTWVLSNHDVPRHASRYDHPTFGDARARLAAMMLLTLRGTPYLYAGEEIGMRNVAVPEDRLQDPLARTLHPSLSRDGERTPMRWDAREPGCGFTSAAEAWLPLGPQPPGTDVAAQRADRKSLLWLYRDLLALRRAHPALQRGRFRALDAPAGVFAYEREHEGERAVVALNFGERPAQVRLGAGRVARGLSTRPGRALPESSRAIALDPVEGWVLALA
ncbi:MAG: alpha-amylase family glycosyl hydrolase [Deltaproteobacteria bacterium]|nr:alpha-amylase family glycosyl hydrolase [Deltaproteobacteria bacterium]